MGKATRAAYGETLIELVEQGLDVVAVDADLACSTTTGKLGEYDQDRLFNSGIAEQNMIGVACGLALSGKIPFTASFASFGTGRVYDQIRNTVCISNLNVKIAPTHSGITVGPDGGTHQMLEDISLMRGLPNMKVLVPADYLSAKRAIELAAKIEGPVYIRLGRASIAELYDNKEIFDFGRAKILKEGSDITIVSCGIEVEQSLEAAKLLSAAGIEAEVIDAFSIKPFDEETVLNSAKKTGNVITVEEHSIFGGLGSVIAELLSENFPTPLMRIGVRDQFGQSGDPEELLRYFGLDSQSITNTIKKTLGHY